MQKDSSREHRGAQDFHYGTLKEYLVIPLSEGPVKLGMMAGGVTS